jgi:class 3 adenylate cyclase/tetratricopeptide (TPR) repeat protein
VLTCGRCGRGNPDGFGFCGFCGAPLAPAEAEVRKLVTIVFSDLTGSTSLGERLDPESIRGVVSRYFALARETLERHGGTVEKFIGDAVMAVFGIPETHEDDAVRAVRAAKDLHDALASLNVELSATYGAEIQVRTGVNSGEVIAGDPAAGQAFVSGDAVNVAARLEQAAAPGEILLGAETVALARDTARVEPVEPLELKGKAERVPAFRLLDVARRGPALARHLDAPMVGRDGELATLLETFERVVAERRCELVTVRGDAGVGKSRLIRELSSRVAGRALVLEGHCLPYGEGITFWPVAEIVKQAADVDEHAPPGAALDAIRALVPETDAERDLVTQRVANAIGIGTGGSSIQETFWAVRRLFETLARERPFVAVIDDIHWASPTLLDLLEYVAGFSVGHALMVVCTARHELRDERPDWGRDGVTISLQPLAPAESGHLIQHLLDETALPRPLRETLVETAGGNPLFLEEMVRMLIDQGSLRREDGRWVASIEPTETRAPKTIQALIAARLDRLDDDERAVLQRGSVIGKVFYWGAVADMSPEDARGRVGGHLQALARRELIAPEASALVGEDAYRFSHILVHDATYTSTPKRTRADLHERFAAWLERIAGERVSEFEEIVGYHLEQAHRYLAELGPVDDHGRALAARAGVRLAEAGRRAEARGDAAAATNLLTRATMLLPVLDPLRVELLPVLGGALIETGRWHDAEAALDRAIDEARQTGDRRSEGVATIKTLWLRLHLLAFASNTEVRPDLERAIATFEELGDDAGVSDALILRGSIEYWAGSADGAVRAADEAIGRARRAGDVRRELEALRQRSFWQMWGPTPVEEALEDLDELDRTSAGTNPMLRAVVQRYRGILEAMRGNIELGRELVTNAQAAARELGLEVDVSSADNALAYIAILDGDPTAAERHVAASVSTYRAMGDLGHLSSYAPMLAEVVSDQGRHEEALALVEEGRRATIEGDTDAEIHWRRIRAKALARMGRIEEALPIAEEAARLARESDDLDKLARTLLDHAEVLRRAGDHERSADLAAEAADVSERKGNVVLADQARRARDAASPRAPRD